MNEDDLRDAIRCEDVKRLSTIPGIGKRTAERLILELKTKVGLGPHTAPKTASSMMEDLSSALKNLGYKEKETEQLISSLDVGPEPKFETLLREALKQLRKGSR